MILITGATGTVGREVMRRWSGPAVPVRAVTRELRRGRSQRTVGRPVRPRGFRGSGVDAKSVRGRGTGVLVDKLNGTHRAATDRLHLHCPTERRAPYREAIPTACRRERVGTVPPLPRGGRSGHPGIRPHLHVLTAKSLYAGPGELPPEYPGERGLLRRRR